MDEKYSIEDLDELEKQLEKCLEGYELGKPLISDDDYDQYKRILQKLRPESYFLTKIGNTPKRNVEELPYILGSLTNKFKDDIQIWLDKYDNGKGFVLSHKLDGTAIECEYTDGKLSGAWLRGDHYSGENIIKKALKIVPNEIKIPHHNGVYEKIYFKGEILLNCEPETLGYKNRRNASAGIINRDNYDRLKYVYVLFHTYVPNPLISDVTQISEIARLQFMQQCFGILSQSVIKFSHVDSKELIMEAAEEMIGEQTQYDKDGIVITVNYSEVENIKLPEKKIAFKFNKMSAETEVETIEWETSRTGRIIPIVKFKPVELGGATIQKATGFHARFIFDNQIGPGAIIKIVRSGDVIPYIEEVIKPSSRYQGIQNCPSCGSDFLSTDDTQTHTYCTNPNCPGQVQKRIAYFFEKLGLENFSEKMISSLGCKNIIDIYNLKREDILKIDGWAETSTDDFLNRIEQTKKARPEKILAALGIENLGTTTSKLILENFSPQDIIDALDENIIHGHNSEKLKTIINKLIQIDGFGTKKITSIIKGLKENKELLTKLIDTGVSFIPISGPLSGLSFCITGSLSKPRKAYEIIIEKFGGTITSISSCKYLICNTPSDSTKFKKAIEKGVKIINEEQLLILIKESKK